MGTVPNIAELDDGVCNGDCNPPVIVLQAATDCHGNITPSTDLDQSELISVQARGSHSHVSICHFRRRPNGSPGERSGWGCQLADWGLGRQVSRAVQGA